jgi:hypothetical protein
MLLQTNWRKYRVTRERRQIKYRKKTLLEVREHIKKKGGGPGG